MLEMLVLFVCLVFGLEFVGNFLEWWDKVLDPSFCVLFFILKRDPCILEDFRFSFPQEAIKKSELFK